jgi:NADPH:quinone reductase-like Zn-dependent oxidoreductase
LFVIPTTLNVVRITTFLVEVPVHAAVVTSFGSPPRYLDHPDPVAGGPDEAVVDVLAAGLHPRVRSQADGSHYTSTGELPLVPGVDAVVRDPTGALRYAVLDGTTLGTIAERTVIDLRRSIVLPAGTDPVAVAAGMNPAMSSWVALRHRVGFRPGQRVLVLGATGNAGRLAVQVARHLGAAHITAAARNETLLATLPADDTSLLDDLAKAAEVDLVLDYLWGAPAAQAMVDLLTARADRATPLTWIEIGSSAGPTAPVPSAALRSARLTLVGSGTGSVPHRDFLAELPAIAAAITDGTLTVDARAVPLSTVEQAWTTATRDRIVLIP